MPPSEEPPTLEELTLRLDDGDDRAAAAERFAQRVLNEITLLEDLPEGAVDGLLGCLSADDPRARSHAVVVLWFCRSFDSAPPDLIPTLVDCATDPDWRVRQAALNPRHLKHALDDVLPPDPIEAGLPERLASILVDRLDDPVPAVRKRAGELLVGRGPDDRNPDLFLHHPDPEGAMSQVIDALADPVDNVTDSSRGRSPRRTAAELVAALSRERPALVEPHLDAIADHLDSEDEVVRTRLGVALVGLADGGTAVPTATVADAVEAIADGRPRQHLEDLATGAALAPEAVEPALDVLVRYLRSRWTGNRRTAADALGRLVRDTDRAFEPEFETLASITADAPFDDTDRDPLVELAADHPRFVAERLVTAHRLELADDSGGWDVGEVLVAAAERNPAVIDAAGDAILDSMDEADGAASSAVLADIADSRPELVADLVSAVLDDHGRTAPVDPAVARLVAATAGVGPAVADETVAALGGTVTSPRRDDRRQAAAALIALREADHAVPDAVEPAVEAAAAGDETDPLVAVAETDQALAADLLIDSCVIWADGDYQGQAPTAPVADADLAVARPVVDDACTVMLTDADADDRLAGLPTDALRSLVVDSAQRDEAITETVADQFCAVIGSCLGDGATDLGGRMTVPQAVETLAELLRLTSAGAEPAVGPFVDEHIDALLDPGPELQSAVTDLCEQLGRKTRGVVVPHLPALLDATASVDDPDRADLVGYLVCPLGRRRPDAVEDHLDRLIELSHDAPTGGRSIAAGTLGQLLEKRPELAPRLADPLAETLPETYDWATRQVCTALAGAAEADPAAVRPALPRIAAVLADFEGVPDLAESELTDHWRAERIADDTVRALARVAADDSEAVRSALEPHGGIESIDLPEAAEDREELQTLLDG
ncbi:HEAT repeat domain-containing protein [Halorientalis pallida]|uniref:Uncharacterized protein n=1 Tax=Halorientalis pallida TaxID=2479928 RepID=A0A498L3G6_9EURY|nr:HEAT repeat domain-containing protein [Halorientalis pallida]RXK48555.1 hypothetical protein EAF64_12820 [Halorientalis pallida]